MAQLEFVSIRSIAYYINYENFKWTFPHLHAKMGPLNFIFEIEKNIKTHFQVIISLFDTSK